MVQRYFPVSSACRLLSRGPLSGLPRASVPKDCAARHQQHQIEPATSQAQELQASCRNLHASTAVPALSSFLHGHLSVVHAVITVYPWPFYFLVRSELTSGNFALDHRHNDVHGTPCTRCECLTTTTPEISPRYHHVFFSRALPSKHAQGAYVLLSELCVSGVASGLSAPALMPIDPNTDTPAATTVQPCARQTGLPALE